jgi:hypothetical protein
MGITIHYHGKIADLARVEEFEDRVVDMALEIGAAVRIWRSAPDADATRVVRGLMLDVAPGQETTSLLISPEGWLVPLHEIEAAENGTLAEPPNCWVKTQFGSVEGHVAVVELLSFLKQEFFPNLDVSDESGYWDDRDWKGLADKLGRMQAIIDAMADGLRASPLSDEAAEDPEIVAARVERIARQVQQALARPPEHPPVRFDDGPDWDELDEAHWDASYKEQRRKQERLHRPMEEQLRAGADHREAFENALRSEGIVDLPGEPDEDDFAPKAEASDFENEPNEPENEPWRASLPHELESDDDPFDVFERERHPLQRQAADLHLRVFKLFEDVPEGKSSHVGTLLHGVGEIGGGLTQALTRCDDPWDGLQRGLALVQLKRSLRGAAFASGALFPLQAEGLLSQKDFEDLQRTLQQLEDGIVGELTRIREQRER